MNILANILFFPMDLLRLTVHAWQFTLDGYFDRFFKMYPEQMCVICRDLDTGVVPRPLCRRANYRNIWMLRILLPEVEVWNATATHRSIPICRNESAQVVVPVWTPLLALGLLLLWTGLVVIAISNIGLIPEEADLVRALLAVVDSLRDS